MHITQTYLGRNFAAGLFVYYMFEDYNDQQHRLTERAQNALDDLGADYMNDIDLFRPNERFANSIAAEVRSIPEIWEYCIGQMPGFLVSYKPLVDLDVRTDTIIYFPILNRNDDDILSIVDRIRQLTRDSLVARAPTEIEVQDERGFTVRLWDSLELKPGVFGVKIDLKKLLRR